MRIKTKRMKKNRAIIILLLLLSGIPQVFAQEKISEVIQDSKIAQNDENALYFIDFWATWCGPCKSASEYLTGLQRVNAKSFYVISMTKENGDIVRNHLDKEPTDLAVMTDFEGQTHKKYNVRTLPYGVLLNASGKVLWKGNASDIDDNQIKYFLHRNRKKINKNKLFRVIEVADNQNEPLAYIPKKDFEMFEVRKDKIEEGLMVAKQGNFQKITGSLSRILTYLLKTEDNQLSMDHSLNKYYEIYASDDFSDYEVMQLILDEKKLEKIDHEKQGDVLFLDLKIGSKKFWDTQQIVWETGTPQFLIDDYQIKGNDVNFNEIKYQLSHVLKKPIIIIGQPYDLEKHDWDIHYKFPNLMIENLNENYGIVAEEKKAIYLTYVIKRK